MCPFDAIQQYSSPKKCSILEHLDGDSTINRYFAVDIFVDKGFAVVFVPCFDDFL
jgi:hypothetical protein